MAFPAPARYATAVTGLMLVWWITDSGNAYVTGETRSPDFPTTGNADDRTKGGVIDAFVAKFFTETGPGSG